MRRSSMRMASSPSAAMSARQRPCTLSNSSRCAVAAAPPLISLSVHHLEPVAGARIVCLAIGRAQGRAQRQPADPAHAVDADLHARVLASGAASSSSRAFSAMRSSVAKGRLTKMDSRRCSAA